MGVPPCVAYKPALLWALPEPQLPPFWVWRSKCSRSGTQELSVSFVSDAGLKLQGQWDIYFVGLRCGHLKQLSRDLGLGHQPHSMKDTSHRLIRRKIKLPSTLGKSTRKKLGPQGCFPYWSEGWPEKEPPKIMFAVASLQGPGIICNSNLERILSYFLQIYSFHMWNEIIKTPHQFLELELKKEKKGMADWFHISPNLSLISFNVKKLFTIMNTGFYKQMDICEWILNLFVTKA